MLRVKALLESAGHILLGALTDADAVALMRSASPDALLIGGGVEPSAREALVRDFEAAMPGRPVIEHVGGPHRLLEHLRQAVGGAP